MFSARFELKLYVQFRLEVVYKELGGSQHCKSLNSIQDM